MSNQKLDDGPEDGDFARYVESLTHSRDPMTGTQSPATNSMTERASQKKAAGSAAQARRPVAENLNGLDPATLADMRKEVLPVVRGAIAVFLLFGVASVLAAPFSLALYVIALAIAARTVYRVVTRSPNLRQQLRDQMARNAERNRRL